MSTRSTIGIENADGTVEAVYCHWDGYLDGVGAILLQNYTDEATVRRLIAGGDMSSLEPDIEDISYYASWNGTPQPAKTFHSVEALLSSDFRQQFNYVFSARSQKWYAQYRGSDGWVVLA